MTYPRRKLEAAALQISFIRGALFALANRLTATSDRDPLVVESVNALYREVGPLEERLAPATTAAIGAALAEAGYERETQH